MFNARGTNIKGENWSVTLICGDCLTGLEKMDEFIFDLALIDPPYFDYKTGHRKDKTGKLSQSLKQQDRQDQLRVVHECIRTLKADRAFFFFTNWENSYWFWEKFSTHLRNQIVWDKKNWSAGDLKGSFGNQYEIIFLGTKGGGWRYSDKRESDLWSIARMGTDRLHPTEKPVALYEKIIINSTSPGAVIVDPYVGSGASAIAAMNTGRNYLGFDIDEEYYARAVRRVTEWNSVK